MDEAQGIDAEDLLSQLDWLGVLARHLVSDQERAKDLVQDACLVALNRRPSKRAGLRGWLAQVITNLHRQRVRSEERVRAREASRARLDVAEATDQAAERVALQRELARFVLVLEEPGRTVVLLRFYTGLPPREIASRLGVSVPVVNGRLQRALSRLRVRLGTESKWDLSALGLLSLDPFAPTASAGLTNSLPIGAWLMAGTAGSNVIKISVCAGLVLAVGVSAWLARPTRPAAQISAVPAASQEALADPQAAADSQSSREVVRSAQSELASAPSAPDGSLRIRFRARAADGSWDETGSGQANVIWNPTHMWGRWAIPIQNGVGVLPPKEEQQAEREWLDFHFVRLGGRRARALAQPLAYPKGPELTVDCEYLPNTELVVYDGPGQIHAKGLVLVEAADHHEWDLQVPIHWASRGPAKVLASGSRSPIQLEDRDGTITYFVRSKDSAWSRIAIDHETPGIRSLHLRPGGRAEFTTLGGTLRPDTRLRIYAFEDGPGPATDATAICMLTPEGRGFVDGLRVGAWEVRAELGPAEYGNPSLGSQIFQVGAGSTTRVTLLLQEPPLHKDRVPVRGEIILDEPIASDSHLQDPRFTLALIAIDPWSPDFGTDKAIPRHEMRADSTHPNRLSWDAGTLSPGPWRAELRMVGWCDAWTIRPDQESEFTIDLTGHPVLKLLVVDRETREPVSIEELLFNRTDGAVRIVNTLTLRPRSDDAIGELTLRTVEGAYDLEFVEKHTRDRHVMHLPSIVQLGGFLEVEFERRTGASVSFSVRSQGANIPLPTRWWRGIQFYAEGERMVSSTQSSMGGSGLGSDPTHATFELPAAGPIEIRFPPLEEFLEIPPMTVELVDGQTTELAIELVPIT